MSFISTATPHCFGITMGVNKIQHQETNGEIYHLKNEANAISCSISSLSLCLSTKLLTPHIDYPPLSRHQQPSIKHVKYSHFLFL